MKRCEDCALYQHRGGGWDLCARTASKDVSRDGTRVAWRYAEVERASFLPWKCGNKARHFRGAQMTRHRTTQIKPATRHALMDQFALAADEIIRLRSEGAYLDKINGVLFRRVELLQGVILAPSPPRWWHRFAWWRK